MAYGIIFAVLPLVIYLVVVVLPAGRPAWIGIIVSGLLIGLIWIGYPFDAGPLWTGDRHADAYTIAAAMLYTVAWGAAAVTQIPGRWLVRRLPQLSYLTVALLVLVAVFVPLLFLLGV